MPYRHRHRCWNRALFAAVTVAAVGSPAATAKAADNGSALEAWLNGEYATGDWGGLRSELEEAGITVDASYVADLLAVRNGNAGSGDGWDYAGLMQFGVNVDLERLVDVPGLSFYASGAWSSGNDLSERKVGNLLAVQQAYTGREVRLSQLYLQQHLLDDKVTLKIGRLTTEDDFLASEIYGNYVNGGINGVPTNIPDGNFGFTTAPFAQWGIVAAIEPIDHLRFAVGVYNADEKTIDERRQGTRFVLDPEDGVFAIGELSYAWHQPHEDEEGEEEPAAGLPGMAKVGIFGESGDREDLRDGRSKDGNPGFYVSLEQMVYREPGTVDQGLTPWAVAAFLVREPINELPVFFGGGLVYKGLIPGRDQDRAAIGFYYAKLSSDLKPSGSEKILELAYTVQLTPWLYVRPDLQLVFDPAGVGSADTAVVFGGEIGITF